MSPQSIALVRDSWVNFKPLAEAAAQRFYDRLFLRYPETRPLFQEDLAEQRRKLMAMLDTTVEALDDLEALRPTLADLGAQHACYGVCVADYDKMADALLWTLSQELGDGFTPEMRAAWTEVYETLADAMMEGAALQLLSNP